MAGFSDKVKYNYMPASDITFKSGMDVPVHRWFRLTPSFAPTLVQEMLSTLNYASGETVYDPFAGAGTTMIECQLNEINSFGTEINPFLHFVGATSLKWNLSIDDISYLLEKICSIARQKIEFLSFDELSANVNLKIPPIYNPTRWWNPDVLKDILVLKDIIRTYARYGPYRNFLLLALASVLVPDLTNVTLDRLQLHFVEKDSKNMNVIKTFVDRAQDMINDLKHVQEQGLIQTSRITLADATDMDSLTISEKADCVITSPPYPNRYSYVWNTRPHLYMFDFFDTSSQSSALDKNTIGGTWGSATSTLKNGEVRALNAHIEDIIGTVVNDIRQRDNLMANYAMKYFNNLSQQILSMERVVSDNVRIAYVIGCSRLKGVYIETDILLAKLFEALGLGYSVISVERLRRRNSGKDLYESIVYAKKVR